MLEAVGNVGTGANGVLRAVSAAVSASAADASSTTGVTRVTLSPRLVPDPVAGVVIAQYLSSTGEMTVQLPSQAVVAYLRSGLSADGSSKRGAVEQATEA